MVLQRRLIHPAKVIEAFVVDDRLDRGQAFAVRRGLHVLLQGPVRLDRLKGDQLVQTFLRSLLRMVKPAYREKLGRLLDGENGSVN